MQGTAHVDLIDGIVEKYAAETSGFRHAMRSLLAKRGHGPDDDEIEVPKRVPDAYLFQRVVDDLGRDWMRATIWEVDVTHLTPDSKIADFAWLWGALDSSDVLIDLEMRLVDRFGTEQVVDLVGAYYQHLGSTDNLRPACYAVTS